MNSSCGIIGPDGVSDEPNVSIVHFPLTVKMTQFATGNDRQPVENSSCLKTRASTQLNPFYILVHIVIEYYIIKFYRY